MRIMHGVEATSAAVSRFGLLTADEVGRIVHVHPSTVRRLAAAGALPATKIGSQWRFDPDELRRVTQMTSMQTRNERVRERARAYAERTIVFELDGQPGGVVIVVQPGHTLEADAKMAGFDDVNEYLLRNFGLVDPQKLKRMSDSWAAPPGESVGLDAEIARAEAELSRLVAQRAAHVETENQIVGRAERRVDDLEAQRAVESKGRPKSAS